MHQLSVSPEAMGLAAGDLHAVGDAIEQANLAATPSIVTKVPAAADEVSVSIAQLFAEHAHDYQVAVGQAAAFQQRFVQNLTAGTAAYTSVEDVLVSLLQGVGTGLASIPLAYAVQVANFLSSANSWINLVPGPLQAFVAGVPFLSIFVFAIPFAFAVAFIQEIIAAISG